MIFYLVPPTVVITLGDFNECCLSRFKLFAFNKDFNTESIVEAAIPGIEMDKVGHFILRCFCLNRPEVESYIIRKETELFLHRLNGKANMETLFLRKCFKHVVKDINLLRDYKELNHLTGHKEKPYFGSMLLSALECISRILMKKDVCEHFKTECQRNCSRYYVEIPFQVCLNLMKSRELPMRNGIVSIPCSKWTNLLEELFIHHYKFGLTMISYSVLHNINSDSRWVKSFETLYNMYNTTKYQPTISCQRVSHNQVDFEKKFFPPCMSHLLNVLRNNHRLTHIWRYYFSLFLKDIGLTLEDSMEFWKREYSKSCSGGTSCTHSWQQNERKYRYSIRHMYGLEGAKVEGRSKSCKHLQNMKLGMRDEGGCPFVHFDDNNLISTVSTKVKQDEDAVTKIIELRNEKKPCEACAVHMMVSLQNHSGEKLSQEIRYESPVQYYIETKSRCLNESLIW